jgi:hypothetical protein
MKITIPFNQIFDEDIIKPGNNKITTIKQVLFQNDKTRSIFAKLKINEKFFVIKKNSENNDNEKKDENSDILEIFEVVAKNLSKNLNIKDHLKELDADNFSSDLNNKDNKSKNLSVTKITQIKLNNAKISGIEKENNSLAISCILSNNNSIEINDITKKDDSKKISIENNQLSISSDGSVKITFNFDEDSKSQ